MNLHKNGQIILELADTPSYSHIIFTFIMNVLVPSSQNYEIHEKLCFLHIFGGIFFVVWPPAGLRRPASSRPEADPRPPAPVGPVDHGPPGPPKINPGSSQEPRNPWQNIGQAKLKRLPNYQQIPSGLGNSTGDVNFSVEIDRQEDGLRPAGGRPRPASG